MKRMLPLLLLGLVVCSLARPPEEEYVQVFFPNGKIITYGGGLKNKYLMERLATLNSNFTIHSSAEFGIEPDWLEAIAFAWFAKQTLEKQKIDLRHITGSEKPVMLGGIYQGG